MLKDTRPRKIHHVNVRIEESHMKKLDSIQEATGLGYSAIFRLLLANASLDILVFGKSMNGANDK